MTKSDLSESYLNNTFFNKEPLGSGTCTSSCPGLEDVGCARNQVGPQASLTRALVGSWLPWSTPPHRGVVCESQTVLRGQHGSAQCVCESSCTWDSASAPVAPPHEHPTLWGHLAK